MVEAKIDTVVEAAAAVVPGDGNRTESTESLSLNRCQRAQHEAVLAAATAANTRRAYRAAVRHFLGWGGVLPCDAALVVAYLLAMAQRHNPRTLSLRLTALSQWHHLQGFADPTAAPTVRKTLRGLERLHGRPRRQAKALTLADLQRISGMLNTPAADLAARRDDALLQLGFFGALRRSELAQLEVGDVQWEPEGVLLTLRRSKTDQEGRGLVRAIPYGPHAGPHDGTPPPGGSETAPLCPPCALRRWLAAAQVGSGPLFRRINRWGQVGPQALHAASISTVLKARAAAAGLASDQAWSSHSLRRGMATSAYRSGADFLSIKRQGGWRHDGTVHGYVEAAAVFDDNAAGYLLQRTRR